MTSAFEAEVCRNSADIKRLGRLLDAERRQADAAAVRRGHLMARCDALEREVANMREDFKELRGKYGDLLDEVEARLRAVEEKR